MNQWIISKFETVRSLVPEEELRRHHCWVAPLLALRYREGLLCCFIGICFPVLQRRSTPGLILKMTILVSKQGWKTDFHDLGNLCRPLGIPCRMVWWSCQIMKIFLNKNWLGERFRTIWLRSLSCIGYGFQPTAGSAWLRFLVSNQDRRPYLSPRIPTLNRLAEHRNQSWFWGPIIVDGTFIKSGRNHVYRYCLIQ